MSKKIEPGIYAMHDYGIEGFSFYNDEPFPSVNEAVKEVSAANYGSPWIIVKVVDWEASEK